MLYSYTCHVSRYDARPVPGGGAQLWQGPGPLQPHRPAAGSNIIITSLSITRLLQRGCSSLRLLHLSGVSPLFSDTFLCSLVTPTSGQYNPYQHIISITCSSVIIPRACATPPPGDPAPQASLTPHQSFSGQPATALSSAGPGQLLCHVSCVMLCHVMSCHVLSCNVIHVMSRLTSARGM